MLAANQAARAGLSSSRTVSYYAMIVMHGVEMVDVREAARLVRRTPETVRRWVWTGRLSAIKHGNKLMLRRREILAISGADPDGTISLRQWADEMQASHTGGVAGATARDLVLADREARESSGAADARR